MKRREVLTLGLAALSAPLAKPALAQPRYPDRPIRLVIPFPPGGVNDAVGRPWADKMKGLLGTVVVENIGGAGGALGALAVSRAQPDGYTLLLGSGGTQVIIPIASKAPQYDPVKAFDTIGIVGVTAVSITVHPSVPAQTLSELVAYAKANPGNVTFGFGLGTPPQIMGEYLKALTGADIVSVPYRGGVQAITDMLGGRIHMYFGPVLNLLPHIRQDKVRPLATTSATRYPQLPDVPTMAESDFPQLELNAWTGILAPSGAHQAVVDALNATVNDSLKSPELRKSFAAMSFETKIMSPKEFATFFAAEARRWPPIIKAAGIKPE
jgi:tripartite-type tricarboxylate transporter receptor subunit TctC